MITRERIITVSLWLLVSAYGIGVFRQLPKGAEYVHSDFSSYFRSSRILASGNNPYIRYPTLGTPGDTPAWFLGIEILSARLNEVESYWVWFAINLAALGASLWLLCKAAAVRHRWILAAAILMYPPIAYNLWGGMQEIFILFVFTTMLIALREEREFLAGMALAIAALLRAYPLGMLGYVLALRRWRVVTWTIVCGLVGISLTVLVVGWPVVWSWTKMTGLWHPSAAPMGQPLVIVDFPNNLNLGAFVKWLFNPKDASSPSMPVLVLAFLSELLLVAFTFFATFSYVSRDDPEWRGFGLWIVTVTWISPLSFIVFMCCFVPLMIGMAATWERNSDSISRRAIIASAAGFGLLTLVPPIGHPLYPLFAHSVTNALGSARAGASGISKMASPASASLSLHNLHWITGARFGALALTWLSAWWFATDQCKPTADN